MSKNILIVFCLGFCLTQSCAQTANQNETKPQAAAQSNSGETFELTEDQWKAKLSPEAYYILREKGTERAFTGKLLSNKKEGTYTCGGCDLPLFSSETKFKSGTGWPSFFKAIGKNNVVEETDNSYGMRRVEILCGRCDGHLGHVFEDGPKPTGLRYCVNSLSLKFEEKK